jgi:cell division transport system permease protein
MVLALMTMQGLLFFDVITDTAITSIQNKIDIAVYFKVGAAEDDMLTLKKSLERLPEVKQVEYISSDKALEAFKAEHANDEVINQALAELAQNPLPASLNVKATDPNNYAGISEYLDKSAPEGLIDSVTYAQHKTAIEKLNQLTGTLDRMGLATTLFLAFAAALVAFSTIRLAIYSNREEIGIMRLVGASNTFTKGPYLVNGVMYGFFGALVALLFTAPLINIANPYVGQLVPEMQLQSYFYANIVSLFVYLVAAGAALGVISSWIATRKYLKV